MFEPTRKNKAKAERQFTDREQFLESFYSTLKNKKKDEYKVLVYYGVGGIGKSSLQNEIKASLKNYDDLIWECIDFSKPTKELNLKEKEDALIYLRNLLKKNFGIEFPSYEIAYASYLKKVDSRFTFDTDNFPFLEAGSIVADIVSTFGDLSFVGLPFKFLSLFQLGKRKFDQWYASRGREDLMALEDFEASQVLDNLHIYFAQDLSEYLAKKSLRAVILIDTYEALWDTNRTEAYALTKDQWIRDLIQELPEVLWVICGRERLRWEEADSDWQKVIEPQQLMGALSEEDSKRFLTSCGIQDEAIMNQIYESSQGLPYYLDLAVDTYERVKKGGKPFFEEFAKTPKEIFISFIKYLDKSEIETLKVLSVPRYWDFSLFEHLVFRFNTGYPITAAYKELFKFSFIKEDEAIPGIWTMHQLMRKSLLDYQEEIVHSKVIKDLFDYYDEQLKNLNNEAITGEQKRYFEEAFYYGKTVLKIDKFAEWFSGFSNIFFSPTQWQFIVPFAQELLILIGKAQAEGHPDADAALNNLNSLGIIVEDMNFDGFMDVRIQQFFPPGPNIPYYYWLWDNSSLKFVPDKELERISDPEFKHEDKTIRSFVRDNVVTYFEQIYKYINNIPTLVRETKSVADPEKDLWYITVRELKDGEMQIINAYDEKL